MRGEEGGGEGRGRGGGGEGVRGGGGKERGNIKRHGHE